jgi:hypothetical protein
MCTHLLLCRAGVEVRQRGVAHPAITVDQRRCCPAPPAWWQPSAGGRAALAVVQRWQLYGAGGWPPGKVAPILQPCAHPAQPLPCVRGCCPAPQPVLLCGLPRCLLNPKPTACVAVWASSLLPTPQNLGGTLRQMGARRRCAAVSVCLHKCCLLPWAFLRIRTPPPRETFASCRGRFLVLPARCWL